MNDETSQFDSLPPKLREQLLAQYGRTPNIDPATERLILSQARAHLLRRKRLKIFAWGGALGAAAAVAVALWPNIAPPPPPQSTPSANSTLVQNDLNHDNAVDMIDVYLLAKSHAPAEKVNALAISVVQISPRSNPQ